MDEDSEEHGSNQHQKEDSLYLSVSVSDTGCGMPEEMKKKCFTLFCNLKFKKDINQGGMGLGLASASLICKALEGELNLIRSEENEGSKFQFTMAIKMGDPIAQGGLLAVEGAENTNARRGMRFKKGMMGITTSGMVKIYGKEHGERNTKASKQILDSGLNSDESSGNESGGESFKMRDLSNGSQTEQVESAADDEDREDSDQGHLRHSQSPDSLGQSDGGEQYDYEQEDFDQPDEFGEEEQDEDDSQMHSSNFKGAKDTQNFRGEQKMPMNHDRATQNHEANGLEAWDRELGHFARRTQSHDANQGDNQKYGFRLKSEEVIYRQDAAQMNN
jgi:hypothetical protein